MAATSLPNSLVPIRFCGLSLATVQNSGGRKLLSSIIMACRWRARSTPQRPHVLRSHRGRRSCPIPRRSCGIASMKWHGSNTCPRARSSPTGTGCAAGVRQFHRPGRMRGNHASEGGSGGGVNPWQERGRLVRAMPADPKRADEPETTPNLAPAPLGREPKSKAGECGQRNLIGHSLARIPLPDSAIQGTQERRWPAFCSTRSPPDKFATSAVPSPSEGEGQGEGERVRRMVKASTRTPPDHPQAARSDTAVSREV
jgi:hypothetical protein